MATTSINSLVLYKTSTGYIPAIVERAYDINNNVVDNLALTDISIVKADLILLTREPTTLPKVLKETTICGPDGSIATGTDSASTIKLMTTNTWFMFKTEPIPFSLQANDSLFDPFFILQNQDGKNIFTVDQSMTNNSPNFSLYGYNSSGIAKVEVDFQVNQQSFEMMAYDPSGASLNNCKLQYFPGLSTFGLDLNAYDSHGNNVNAYIHASSNGPSSKISLEDGFNGLVVIESNTLSNRTWFLLQASLNQTTDAIFELWDTNGNPKTRFWPDGSIGFFGASKAAKQTVTGSKGGNAALTSLISALSAYGLITDSTS